MREYRLSQQELKEIRELLKSEERTRWIWASVRIWAGWIASVITATVAVYMSIRQIWQ